MSTRISYLIKWVERGLRAELDAALRTLEVTTPEYTAMSVLSRRGGLSSAQLARRAFVSAQAMNQIIGSLERQGYVVRSADPDNARILRAKLTEEGVALLGACDRATAQVERRLLAKLSTSETRALRRTLESCAGALAERTRSAVS